MNFKSDECTFVSYSPFHKGYKCLTASGKIIISRHVIFNETHFPFSCKSSVTTPTLLNSPVSPLACPPITPSHAQCSAIEYVFPAQNTNFVTTRTVRINSPAVGTIYGSTDSADTISAATDPPVTMNGTSVTATGDQNPIDHVGVTPNSSTSDGSGSNSAGEGPGTKVNVSPIVSNSQQQFLPTLVTVPHNDQPLNQQPIVTIGTQSVKQQ